MEAIAEDDTVLAGLARAQLEGKLRTDIDLSAVLEFVMIVLNGMAVRVVSGNQLDVDSVVRIVNAGLRPGDQGVPCSS
jgi:hypothetical protein